MKKLIITFLVFIFSFSFGFAANCSYNWSWSIVWALDSCLSWTDLVDKTDANVSGWFKTSILDWNKKIAWFLAIWAVFAIVYWAIHLQLSFWADEKIKKAKDMIKWWLIWFLWIISAGFLITLVVNIMYSL